MSERVVQFGERRRLVGTFTPPAPGLAPRDVGFVMFNAGVIPRIGPQRMYVKFAREMASLGFAALRFDLSGQGDSRAATGTLGFERQAVADVRAALDHLAETQGLRRFVLAGLCSGADHSYAAALEDPRVVGVVMLEPYAYPTLRTHLRSALARLRRAGFIGAAWRTLKGRLSRASATAQAATGNGRHRPSKDDFARGLAALAGRGVEVYLLYSGSMTREYNYAGQFADGFRRYRLPACVSTDYIAEANHNRTELAMQRAWISRVTAWSRRFVDAPAAAIGAAAERRPATGTAHAAMHAAQGE
ncbi:MAG: alpha/beta hydrolase [Mizugakiibacter sp.]|uniref:alpha/beta fold hydrolase n=1 Tax=Mizugakiibacter sp. TaxID=1972610 RepID=UPI0031BE460B|nr:alpha/beta fold hydrolase [Xanthomonadaceae bacterium]